MEKADQERIRLAHAVNQASDGVIITDPNRPDNPIIYVNETFLRITGYALNEILGKNPRFLQGSGTDAKTREEIRRAVLEKRQIKTAVLNYRKNGQSYWNGLRISPIFATDGTLQYFLGFHADITDRIRMEEMLIENNDRFQKVIQATKTVVWDWNLLTDAFHWSQNFSEVFKLALQDVKQGIDLWHQNIHAEEVSSVRSGIDRAIAGGKQGWSGQYRFRCGDGSYADIEHHTYITRNREQKAISVTGAMQDVSDKKKLQAQLVQSQKMETVGTLAGGIAHDLNNQLTPVKGYVDLILQQMSKEDDLYQYLLEAQQAVERCQEVVERLLGFSRPSTQKKSIIHLGGILWELKNLLPKFLPAFINSHVYFDQELWPVEGNDSELLTVIMNLSTNARDAMPSGGTLQVDANNLTLDAASVKPGFEPGAYAKISVADSGKGMPQDVASRIFEPFFTTKKKGEGTGLGLAMVFGIIKDHKGWIEVTSRLGKGTTFFIYLPARPGDPLTEKKENTAPISKGGETILLADDEDTLRMMGKIFLERQGYKTLLAQDGEQAVALYSERHAEIHGVILDMTMPKLSGRQVIKKILEINPKAKILAVSGYTSEGSTQDILGDGAKAFLPKPFTVGPFIQSLRKVLDS